MKINGNQTKSMPLGPPGVRKFEDFGSKDRLRSGLGDLWEHSLAPRGTQTRLGESCRAQASSQGGKKERQKGTKMPPREALADILERKCGPNGCHETKNHENVRIAKTMKNTFFPGFSSILGYLGAEKSRKFEENRRREATRGSESRKMRPMGSKSR